MGASLMTEIENKLKEKAAEANFRPVIFDLTKKEDESRLSSLFSLGRIFNVSDDYIEQERELFQVNNPALVYLADFEERFGDYLKKKEEQVSSFRRGRWAYFSWSGALAHILEEDDFQRVRTARNKGLITDDEQRRFYDLVLGICGLSVGNSVALAVVIQGGSRRMRLADYDTLALSNLNRIRAGVQFLGVAKAVITARQIYEINPYAEVEIFQDGITRGNIGDFFAKEPRIDMVIDEVDDMAMKFLIRKEAQERRVPVLMATDNGDGAIVDIERYDLETGAEFFNGRIGKITYEELACLDKLGIGKMIERHIGLENVTERARESLNEIGKTIVSWPQLGGAAFMSGLAVAYCARKIAIGGSLRTKRAILSLERAFEG